MIPQFSQRQQMVSSEETSSNGIDPIPPASDWEALLQRAVDFARQVSHRSVTYLRKEYFAPAWLPPAWCTPGRLYLLSALISLLAILMTRLLVLMLPNFTFVGLLALLGIVTVSLNFGAGPGLFATLLSGLLLNILLMPPYFVFSLVTLTDCMEFALYLAVGTIISHNVGQTAQSRRAAELATQLTSATASKLESMQRRTQTTLDALLQIAAALVPQTEADAATIAHRLAQLTCQVLGCSRVGITVVEGPDELLRPVAVVGLSPEEEELWWSMQPTDAHLADASDPASAALLARFLAGEALEIDMAEPPFDQQANPFGITLALYVPMRSMGRVVGILSLDHSGARHLFTEDEKALANSVANLAALVLERERMTAERTATEAQVLALQDSNRRMEEFIKLASHELRTPLTSIKGTVEGSQRQLRQIVTILTPVASAEEIDATHNRLENIRVRWEQLNSSTVRLNRLIGDLLDAASAPIVTLDLRMAEVDLVALTRQMAQEQQANWPERTIQVQADVPTLPIRADGDRLAQVITNYLSNALKYSAADQPVTVEVSATPTHARVAVTDQGPGIEASYQGRLFERFYRVPGLEPLSGSGMGLGLGLYISRTLIERHHGRLGVESEPGIGSTFWFEVPLTQPE